MDFQGKKILILGASAFMNNVVEVARSIGVYTIVVDPIDNHPAKKKADKSYNLDTTDIDGIVEIARKEHADGIMTGYSDINLSVCGKVCDILGLHFYATMEQIEITKDKICFKKMCKEYSIPTVKEYTNDSFITYPIIAKPSDSYSGKGMTICYNAEDLSKGIQFASQYSKSFLLEKYMDSRTVECVNIDYVIIDGQVVLSAVGDKYVNNEQGNKTPLTSAVIYPSKYTNEYIDTLNDKVCEMFRSSGFKNGVMFIESFYDEDGFHFYEMGYRLGGGQSSILLNKICGIDYVKMLIHYAITGSMYDSSIKDKINPVFSNIACGLVVLLKRGIISKISGLEEIEKNSDVVSITRFLYEGEEITSNMIGTLGQSLARIHIVSDDLDSFKKTLLFIQGTLKVTDENGNSMLLSIINDKVRKNIFS
ncbi:MAG: acetyl-CoA carboxylase biotin carboxylase subunit family protein [Mangrovibacterium sp.]